MPIANVRGAAIHYEIVGTQGPWVALSPGGRRAIEGVESLAKRIAAAGYSVLVHDRRNCGSSDVSIEGPGSENDMWADDLHELLRQQNALPAWIGGSSSGCRLALLFALRHRSTLERSSPKPSRQANCPEPSNGPALRGTSKSWWFTDG